MDTSIHVHGRGEQVRVEAHGSAIWLSIPLSDDGTARLALFLNTSDALAIGRALTTAGEKNQRIEAIHAERVA